ncbi:MAG: hypothetical protein SVY10_06385 [Thermodesulfobacteriota bacterium]|nr:hypothetical protein [Thermodesulfobacteriota bacterium]
MKIKNFFFLICAGILAVISLTLISDAYGSGDEPDLPVGLEDGTESAEPELPLGLGVEEKSGTKDVSPQTSTGILSDLGGFWEIRCGIRTQDDPHEKDFSLGETRFQLETQKSLYPFLLNLKTDFLYDPVFDHHTVRLEDGDGFVDLREANAFFAPFDSVDIKIGRQILTWGTGDMLFLNDLFPKDWKSFFIGRDVEYLKAPSDAIKVSIFSTIVDVDIVYTPRFDPDRFIEGERISYWNSMLNRRAGQDATVDVVEEDEWLQDSETAVRISRNIRGYEISAYGYYGFWKSPAGFDPTSGKATFPELSVYGMSFRGNLLKGIGNLEFSYYETRDDQDGDDPYVRNSEFRNLVGYEQEIATNFTLGVQYYVEYMLDYDSYLDHLPEGTVTGDELRHVFTVRLTKLLMNQNLKLSLFTFYSPSDQDAYLRPLIQYKIDDNWVIEGGGNLFVGEEDFTFFGQFEKNSNVYAGLRYGF